MVQRAGLVNSRARVRVCSAMATPKRKLCAACIRASRDPLFSTPAHLVHPESGRPGLFDIHGNAICPDCGALWHRPRNEVKLVG